MKTLYFYLEKPFHFFVIDNEKGNIILDQHGVYEELDDVIPILKGFDQVVGLIPGEFVSVLEVSIPIRSRKKAIQALPYALEDQVAANIDELHFALLEWNPAATSTVAVINRDKWFGYLLWMQENDIVAHRIVPDFDLLPLQLEESAMVFLEEFSNRVLIKFKEEGLTKGMAISMDELPFWIEEFDAREQTLICNDEGIFQLTENIQALGQRKQIEAQALHDMFLQVQPKQNHMALYMPEQSREFFERSKPWLIGGIACLLMSLIIHIGFDINEYRVLKTQQKAMNEKIEEIFAANFPQIERIVDARLQFQREINELQGSAEGTQELLFLLENVVKSVPKNVMRVDEIFYRSSALNVTLKANNFQVLDQFTAKLDTINAVKYERIASDSQGGKVTAKYRLTANGEGG